MRATLFRCIENRTKFTKVFCFFSSEKKILPLRDREDLNVIGFDPVKNQIRVRTTFMEFAAGQFGPRKRNCARRCSL